MISNYTYSKFATNESKIWYITRDDNFLMEIDIANYSLECLGKIPNTEKGSLAYRTLYYYDGCLYLLPYNAKNICLYDLRTKKFCLISVLGNNDDGDKKLYGILWYGNEKILYGLKSNIYRIGSEENVVKTYQMKSLEKQDISTWFMEEGCVYGNQLILLVNNQLMLMVLDLKTGKMNRINIESDIADGINQKIFCEKEKLYYLIIDSKWQLHIIEMNIKDLKVISQDTYIIDYEEEIDSTCTPFQCGFIRDEKLFLFPGQQSVGCLIDLKNKECKVNRFLPITNRNTLPVVQKKSYNYFDTIYLESKGVYFSINWEVKKMIFLNPLNFMVQDVEIVYKNVPEEQYLNVVNQIVNNSTILYEKDRFVSMKDLIKIITDAN